MQCVRCRHLLHWLVAAVILALAPLPDANADVLPETYLARSLAAHKFVMLGEKHDNPEHHRIQARLLAGLVAAGRRPAVVWEMIVRDKQPAIDAFAATGETDPDRFAEIVDWAGSGWPDWTYYRPIAEVALAAGLPMVAGNIGRDAVRTIARSPENVTPELRTRLKLDEPLPENVEQAIGDEVYRGHCELVPREHLAPMVRVQIARDASLAEAMVRASGSADGAVLIAGGQHVRKDIGTGYHLRRRFGVDDVAAIALLERSGTEVAEPDLSLSRSFDFVWMTDKAHPEKNYCAELEARFSKHK
ncbi:ChaN family lipoprotein [Nisaea acidiphila]|uniref:ChaN family lipoprotein n=1 Tax=Nisaea acidiphila TaxID=1862145 RepID=A0A9J7AQG1_9PROT|nr:ChaN family lipoprotein [Nisaea acidiphila]UUX48596.1 ChaN family lipoprotein [Nisaea acidiphila]